MTEPVRAPKRAAKRPARPGSGWVFGGSLAVFFAVLALLAFQVRTAQEPAPATTGQPVAQTKTKPREIVVRKIIRRIIIEDPAPVAAPAAAPAPAPAQVAAPAPALVAAPAPAPATAPAPLTTHSS